MQQQPSVCLGRLCKKKTGLDEARGPKSSKSGSSEEVVGGQAEFQSPYKTVCKYGKGHAARENLCSGVGTERK